VSNVVPLRETTAADTAAEWLVKIDRGIGDSELEQLREWLDADSMHTEALMLAAEIWDKTESLSLLADLVPLTPKLTPRLTVKQPRTALLTFCSLVLAVGLGFSLFQLSMQAQAPTPAVYETAVGGLSQNLLADGSTLVINTNTRLQALVTGKSREITLERGELAIDVEHDPTRPLRVYAAGKQVEALGTLFSVHKINDSSIDVTVAEGRVVVTSDNASSEPEFLEAGQRAVIDHSGVSTIYAQSKREIEDQLAWRAGQLIFRGETLQEAVDELSRYTSVVFEIADPQLKGIRVAALVQPGDVDGFLRALEANFELRTRRVGNRAIIYPVGDSRSSP